MNSALSSLVMSFMMSSIPSEQQECLALNVYHEARDQSHLGQVATAQVVLNRVNDERYPSTIWSVVRQQRFNDPPGSSIQIDQCQFSWYCDGKSDAPTDDAAWHTAREQAAHGYYLHDIGYDVTEGATHYHSTAVTPNWSRTKILTVSIDDHIFYRWE